MRTEHEEQALVVQWAKLNERRFPELQMLYAIPNGGDRHPAVAARLKATGTKKGVPDLCLAVPRSGFHSLYLEMKRRKPRRTKTKGLRFDRTKTSPEQDEWIAGLRAVGHAVRVCWSAEEAQDVIERYLNGTLTEETAHE